MHYALISGSHRQSSQSARIAGYLAEQLKSAATTTGVDIIDLGGNPLPLWDESVWAKDPKWQSLWQPISERLQAAQGIVVIAPEWGGMVPAGLRNFFHFCGAGELAHKAGLIVGVSASRGGSYPVAELRLTSAKNTKIVYVPDHLIIRNCDKVLLDGEPVSDEDRYIRGRVAFTLEVFGHYTQALSQMREAHTLNHSDFGFGM